ncbi:MAG: ABC transporter permease [Deltaproteobacteria bacterium]|nr:ABC transporter permease [Deltaproteobacteria bacterium]
MRASAWQEAAWKIIPFLPILALWQGVASLGLYPRYLLPDPLGVLWAFIEHGQSGALWVHMRESLVRLLLGVLIGGSTGIVLGIAMGISRPVARFFTPIITLGQAIPGLAWIPLAILWFGLGTGAIVFIIFASVLFPVLFNTISGIQTVPQVLLNAALTLGATRLQVIREVVLGALPSVIMGLRIGIGYGWRALVGGEMIAAASGLGFLIFNARQFLESEVVVVGMLTIGVSFLILDSVLLRPFEQKTIERWGVVGSKTV